MEYECHGHIILDGISFKNAIALHSKRPDEAVIRERLSSLHNKNISFYRDGGDCHGVSLLAKQLSSEYDIDYRTPAFAIYPKGHYGGMFGISFSSLSECEELILYAKRLGADYIKLMMSGILDFNTFGQISGGIVSSDIIKQTIQISHREGMSVMVHVNTRDSVLNAILCGADSIEHGFYMDDDCIDALSFHQCIWVPTLSPVEKAQENNIGNKQVLERILTEHKSNIKKALAQNVLIACGSDAGSFAVPPDGCLIEKKYLLSSVPDNQKQTMTNAISKACNSIKERF